MKNTLTISNELFSLVCPACSKEYPADELQSFATCCNEPLVASFSNSTFKIDKSENSMWRYRSMLPLNDQHNRISLNEGWTPIHSLEKIAAELKIENYLLKDEGVNPTGSFKARGMSMAVSKLKESGVDHCVIPTAGNAGGALSAYCAKANIKVTVIMPEHTSMMIQDECKAYGAEVILVKGLINDCAVLAKKMSLTNGAMDMSTMKEPYRLEGKKTLGYEIAEQCANNFPDVILYPAGGGTGLIGIYKGFKELKALGMFPHKMPRMVAVQSANCNPLSGYYNNNELPENYAPRSSFALGLAVPFPFAKNLIVQCIRETNGTVVDISEQEMQKHISTIAKKEGLLLSPEGSACIAAAQQLRTKGWIKENETVLSLNTGSWYKYH
jgi:threonine synthase